MGSKRLTIDAVAVRSLVLAPVPLSGLGRKPTNFEVEGAKVVHTISARSGQQAYVLEPNGGQLVLHFTFTDDTKPLPTCEISLQRNLVRSHRRWLPGAANACQPERPGFGVMTSGRQATR